LKASAGQFRDVELLTTLEIEPLHQFARDQKTIGITDFLDFDFHGGFPMRL
jgi:hypothetical protein